MKEGFYISTDKTKLDVDLIWHFLSNNAYWAQGRSKEIVERSIEHSLCFGVYNANNEQVGFARVISDFAIFAWLMDVFILDACRGKGLGKLLMAEILGSKELQGLKRWGLNTKDAHGLYEQHGFRQLSKPENMMELIAMPAL